ncbi:MAG: hypothetical protein CFE34_13835 [Rhodobacteraceae bacterium PARR1]|nr:MAG: hypothetical protein CFE34_13835 [Rhodobacteraceae bacterium PARR1]
MKTMPSKAPASTGLALAGQGVGCAEGWATTGTPDCTQKCTAPAFHPDAARCGGHTGIGDRGQTLGGKGEPSPQGGQRKHRAKANHDQSGDAGDILGVEAKGRTDGRNHSAA